MNTLFLLTVCGIAVLFTATCVEGAAYYWDDTTTGKTTTPTTRRTLPPEELAATSDFPESPKTPRICAPPTACGWAVYTPFSRKIEYFTKNICICPDDKSCQRVDDDLAIAAYVYKCGPKLGSTDSYPIHY